MQRHEASSQTVDEGLVIEGMPIKRINPLTSQSTAFEHNRSATESGLRLIL